MKVKEFFVKLGRRIKSCFGVKSAIFLLVCLLLLAADLLTKHFAEADGWSFTVIPGFINVVKVQHNDGAAFESFSGAVPFLITLTYIAIPVFIAVVLLLPERFPLLKFCMYMVIAGAVGNLVDRIAFGYVRDFIAMDFGFISFVCNFADIWLVVGVIIMIIDLLFLNEWAAFPLTKKARAVQAERKRKEELEKRQKEEELDMLAPYVPGSEIDKNSDEDAEDSADTTEEENNADDIKEPAPSETEPASSKTDKPEDNNEPKDRPEDKKEGGDE